MIDTVPGCLSAAAFSLARSRHAAVVRQDTMSATIELLSPRASALTKAVIADCSAAFALSTLASRALITRNTMAAVAIATR